jgi:hypothetical protein
MDWGRDKCDAKRHHSQPFDFDYSSHVGCGGTRETSLLNTRLLMSVFLVRGWAEGGASTAGQVQCAPTWVDDQQVALRAVDHGQQHGVVVHVHDVVAAVLPVKATACTAAAWSARTVSAAWSTARNSGSAAWLTGNMNGQSACSCIVNAPGAGTNPFELEQTHGLHRRVRMHAHCA